jgi:hypothetical protein
VKGAPRKKRWAGFYEYYFYQKDLHKSDFSLMKFVLGSHQCTSVKGIKNTNVMG